ncbi:hypothetical protein EST38_g4850 [Candolleomyces aberdarensis]|uniref:PPP4R2-domain-containing protein n=1 Tax=Candolleomyces aberdarensis TaxID=2316362 RepID=A0A4Q2DPB4_9AGAR|nr:hypothetical protein EST38_g4850 [Candolleomyces aberdarensis]
MSQDNLLRSIADTDDVQGIDWNDLRQAIRDRVEHNVKLFTDPAPSPPTPFNVTPSTQGGLRLAPFPPKKFSQLHMYDPPLSYMNPEEVKDAVQAVFDQLDAFDGPPFTIQRLCELLIEPKKQYKSVGKYLRAVEKSILVTSTYDSFPQDASINASSNGHATPVPSIQPLVFTSRSRPSTPLFSPIAFLHEDARIARSRSRSISPTRLDDAASVREATLPPPSPPPDSEPGTPLLLSAELPSKPDEKVKQEVVGEPSVGIGLVDELDDPSPGHMSEVPTPLTAIAAGKKKGKPIFGSLKDRFVKSEIEGGESSSEEKASKKPKVEEMEDGEKVKAEEEDNKMELDSSEAKS